MIKTEITCPLGSKCEEIKNDTLHRCRWYTQVQGMDPQTGEQLDKWDCAIAWIPILTIEMSRTNRGQTAALESFRNEMIKSAEVSQQILLNSTKNVQIIEAATTGNNIVGIIPTTPSIGDES